MATFLPAVAGASAPFLVTAGAIGAGAYMVHNQVPGADSDEKYQYMRDAATAKYNQVQAEVKAQLEEKAAVVQEIAAAKAARVELAFQLIIGLLAILTLLLAVNLFVN